MPTRRRYNRTTKTGFRTRRRSRNAKMTRDQVFAAHALHVKGGYSVAEISKLIWERYGYKDSESCRKNLHQAFRSYGLRKLLYQKLESIVQNAE